MVLLVNPPDHGSAKLNSTEHKSATAPSLGKLTSSLPELDAFTFARQWYSANDHRKNFMINHNKIIPILPRNQTWVAQLTVQHLVVQDQSEQSYDHIKPYYNVVWPAQSYNPDIPKN